VAVHNPGGLAAMRYSRHTVRSPYSPKGLLE